MKNSIKTLTILLVAILVSNVAKAVNYTLNNTTWSPSTPTSLTSSDSVTVTGGTWALSANTTVRGVRLAGGNLNLGARRLTGRVTVASNATLTSGSGSSITSYLVLTGGTLTLASGNASVSDLIFKGGSLNLATFNLTASNSTIVASAAKISSDDTTMVDNNGNNLNITGGTLTLNKAELLTDNLIFASSTTHKIRVINGGVLSFDNSSQHTLTNVGNNNHVFPYVRLYTKNGNTNSFTFPIGDSTIYAPIRLAPGTVGTTGTATKYFEVVYTGAKNDNTSINTSSIQGVSGAEFWTINNDATNPTATVTLLYNSNTTGKTGKTAITDTTNMRADLKIAKINSGSWSSVTSSANNAPAAGLYSIISSGAITPKGIFSLGSSNARTPFLTPLPVSIIDFSAKANDNNIEIKWSTASEKDNAAFVVEKSIDGQVWSAIGSVKGAKTSNIVNNYGLVDFKAVAGFQYFRLKQIDVDGTVNYSKSIAVNFSKASTLSVNLFPNPAKDALNITTENNATGEVNIQILNSMGETVYNQVVEAGLVQTIDIASFIPGVYYVTVIAEGESKIIRLLKN